MTFLRRLHCAILKALFNIKLTRAHKARNSEITFKIFEMRSLRSSKYLETT